MHRRPFVLGVLGLFACGRERAAPRTRARAPEAAPPESTPLVLPTPPGTHLAGDALTQRAEELRRRHAGRGFTIVVEAPFVVIGDGEPWKVARRAQTTIRWAVTRLREAYFRADPTEIIDIYLFRDDESYTRHARELFADRPETPYGYYSPTHAALIMNISTGGGTLVHEIVHPFIASNFPSCPTWFNEGLASLYEQCDERDGDIIGLTNWRLPALQAAIRADALAPYTKLCAATSEQFYKQDPGTNYAQARYLCHYLQEHGLLHTYYHRLVAGVAGDPGGALLLRELASGDEAAFEAKWRRYVLGLHYA
jgi:hypothetical protein